MPVQVHLSVQNCTRWEFSMRYYFLIILLSVFETGNGWQSLRKLNERIDHLESIVSGLQSLLQKQESDARQIKNVAMDQGDLGREQERGVKDIGEIDRNQISCVCDQRNLMKTPKQNKEKESNVSKEIPIPLEERGTLKFANERRERRDFHRRAARQIHPVSSQAQQNGSGVAFYAYMSGYLLDPAHDQIVIFQSVVTNIGSHYNQFTGVFSVPDHGVYVFTWTIVVYGNGYIYTQILVNSNVVGSLSTSAFGVSNERTTTGIVVVSVEPGDVVFIKTNPHGSFSSHIISTPDFYRSTFSGWKLF